MKAIFNKLTIWTAILISVALSSCTKSSINGSSNASVQSQVQTHVQSGGWRISKFIDSGTDETSNFNGFSFSFQSNGVLNATNGSVNYSGTWSITDSNSNDDSKDDLDFNINFNLTNDFEDLNDDWDIVSYSSNKIELYDVSGGGGGTDYLTIEKM